jgi:DNA-binding response OmpR family regulator
MSQQILVVDDEKTFRYFLSLHLKEQGYEVSEAEDGRAAIALIDQQVFDLALIDLRLTDMNGLDVVRHIRKSSPQTSVIILTGYATLDSAIEALRQGAHDYVTKPFDTAELLASVADGLARQKTKPEDSHAQPPQNLLQVQDLTLNPTNRQLSRNGEAINLTPTEFDILSTLMARPNTAIDSVSLIKAVLGYEATEADARAIARVHVHRLRHKLERDPTNPCYVITIAGGRYLLNTEEL